MYDLLIPPGWTATTFALAGGVFVIAGIVKGIAGAGMPTVALALLLLLVDLKTAIVLLLVPTTLTNIYQAAIGGHFIAVSRRLASLLLVSAVGTWFGVMVLVGGEPKTLSGILGILLIAYAIYCLSTPVTPRPSQRVEPWLSPIIGGITGVIFGFTGSFLVPGVLYMQALGFPRDIFVQAMGVAFTFSTLVLWAILAIQGVFTLDLGWASAIFCLPALVGLAIGTRIRTGMNEVRFRKVFFASLLLIAIYIVAHAFL
jgi:hypothetical protein